MGCEDFVDGVMVGLQYLGIMNESDQIKSLLTEFRNAQDFAKHQENMRIVFEMDNCELRETVKSLNASLKSTLEQMDKLSKETENYRRDMNQSRFEVKKNAFVNRFLHRVFSKNLTPEDVDKAREYACVKDPDAR